MTFARAVCFLVLVFLTATPLLAVAQPEVSVENLAENVYLYTYNTHRSLFVVTEDGILATDPQSMDAGKRYVEEIRKLSSSPIRYLVYSHHHDDHVSGGAAFGDAVVIGHEKAIAGIKGKPDIVPIELSFDEESRVYLSGLEIRLIYPGPSETDSNIIVFIPARKVAFMVDAVAVRTVPWRNMAGGNPTSWVSALEVLETLDFEILAPGHGPTGKKAHVREYITYMNALTDAVRKQIESGKSLEAIQAALELPQYKDWVRYDQHFKLNIEGIHRELAR